MRERLESTTIRLGFYREHAKRKESAGYATFADLGLELAEIFLNRPPVLSSSVRFPSTTHQISMRPSTAARLNLARQAATRASLLPSRATAAFPGALKSVSAQRMVATNATFKIPKVSNEVNLHCQYNCSSCR